MFETGIVFFKLFFYIKGIDAERGIREGFSSPGLEKIRANDTFVGQKLQIFRKKSRSESIFTGPRTHISLRHPTMVGGYLKYIRSKLIRPPKIIVPLRL